MKTLAMVLAALYLHQHMGTWSECLLGAIFGLALSKSWRDHLTASFGIGLGWLVTAFLFDQLSSGRVEQIGAVFSLPTVEGTYALTFFVGFLAFFSCANFTYQLKRARILFLPAER